MKILFFALLYLFFHYSTHAQNFQCASTNSIGNNNPAAIQQEINLNNQVYNYLLNSRASRSTNAPLIIPVVFHIVHMNGPENVSDAVLLKELDSLNAWFSNSAQFYNPLGTDVNIQFCLASVDPYGNATNGITRDTSHFTVLANSQEDIRMKNVNRWNPYQYLNIWIARDVLNAYGASAYSSFPWYVGQPVDGIVIQSSSLGYSHYIITHEVGHYLGLYHTSEGNSCINFNCMMDGDHVCDTPPEIAGSVKCDTSTCNTDMNDTTGMSPFTTDTNDLSNLMGPKQFCPLYYFTPGQSDRMNAYLTQTRNELLLSNGCGQNPGGIIPQASFTYQEIYCNYFQFFSTSINAQYLEWDFNNDGYIDAIGDTVGFNYPASGIYTVVLRAFNSGGGDTANYTTYFHARPTNIYPLHSQSGISQYGACKGSYVSFTAAPGMTSYLWSTGDTTQTISFVADTAFDITLTCVDSTGYTWQRCPTPTVHYSVVNPPAAATISTTNADSICHSDTIYMEAHLQPHSSIWCWVINNFNSFIPDTIFRIYPYSNNFEVSVIVIDSNQCQTKSDTLNFYVDGYITLPYIAPIVDSTMYGKVNWHNQFYLDGIPIPGATQDSYTMTQPGCYNVSSWYLLEDCQTMSDTFCLGPVGIPESILFYTGKPFPNPSRGIFTLQFNANTYGIQDADILVRNLIGEKINSDIRLTEGNHFEIEIDISNYADGIYIADVKGKTIKLIKMNE